MEKQESINSWKSGDSKYNSLFDELARHITSKHKIKFKNIGIEEIWNAFLQTFSKLYSIPLNQLVVNRKFSIQNQNQKMKYYISNIEEFKLLKYRGKFNKDLYDTTFEFKYRKWTQTVVILYSEHILREKTLTGLSDQFNKLIFKRSARRNKKLLKNAINYQLKINL